MYIYIYVYVYICSYVYVCLCDVYVLPINDCAIFILQYNIIDFSTFCKTHTALESFFDFCPFSWIRVLARVEMSCANFNISGRLSIILKYL